MASRVEADLEERRTDRGRSTGGRFTATDLALIAAFAALTAVLALAPGVPVAGLAAPIVLQNLGVMLAGALLGWKRGAAAIALMILVGFLGVPMLSNGRSMWNVLGAPSLGFVIGYVLAAAVIGALVQARLPRAPWWWVLLACVVGGVVVDYAVAVPIYAARLNLSWWQTITAFAAYLPGDLVKAAIAAAVVPAVHRAVPGLTPPLRGGGLTPKLRRR